MIPTATKRVRKFILCAVGLSLVYGTLLLFRDGPEPPFIPPMPGTYQYFTEVDQHYQTKKFGAISHCDPRFCPSSPLAIEATRQSLTALLSSFALATSELKVETWIAHGALLGWYWNQRLLPWDTDIDVQLSFETLKSLASSNNMTEYKYTLPEEKSPRIYLLDINPHYVISSSADVANKIDARWIDTTNGKYIDITAVHLPTSDEGSEPVDQSLLFCKDGHRYKVSLNWLAYVICLRFLLEK
jgi:hypothetical protein